MNWHLGPQSVGRASVQPHTHPRRRCPHVPFPGMNILLVARCKDRLASCAAELQEKYGMQTRTCLVDLQTAGPLDWARIEAAMQGLQVSDCRQTAACMNMALCGVRSLTAALTTASLFLPCMAMLFLPPYRHRPPHILSILLPLLPHLTHRSASC